MKGNRGIGGIVVVLLKSRGHICIGVHDHLGVQVKAGIPSMTWEAFFFIRGNWQGSEEDFPVSHVDQIVRRKNQE